MLVESPMPEIDNIASVDRFSARFPAGTSAKLFEHIAQIRVHDRLQMFDYGATTNLEVYNSLEPPQIGLNLINGIPIALFTGELDLADNVEDNQWLYSQISEVLVQNTVVPGFGHFNFLTAEDTEIYLTDIVELLENYNY